MRSGVFSRAVAAVLAILFVFPTIIVVATSLSAGSLLVFPPSGISLRWYEAIVTDGRWMDAAANSALVGVLAAVLAMIVGVLLAIGAARGNLLPSGLVTGIALSPMIVPTVVMGVGVYVVALNTGLTGSVLGLALAHSALGVPFVFISTLASLTAVETSLEEAARVSGANEFVTFLTVTFPLIAPSAVIGGVLAFIGSWDEVIVAGFLTTPTFRTLPVLMLASVREGAEPSTSAVAVILTLVSVLVMSILAGAGFVATRRRAAR